MSDIATLEARLAIVEAENRTLHESRGNPYAGLLFSILLSATGAGGVSAGVVNYQQSEMERKVVQLETMRAELATLQFRLQYLEDDVNELGTFRINQSELVHAIFDR